MPSNITTYDITTTTAATTVTDSYLSRMIKSGILLAGQMLSVPCYLFILYHLVATKTARQVVYNHVVFIIMILNFLIVTYDLSMVINYYEQGVVSPATPVACFVWQYIDYACYNLGILLILWASIERHIFIFSPHLINSFRRRLMFHYFPITALIIYTCLFYIYVVFFYPCDKVLNFTRHYCGRPCYINVGVAALVYYESFAHQICPIFLIAFLSGLLLFRVVRQKQRVQQTIQWRQFRKMTIQLIYITVIQVVFAFPYITVVLINWSGFPTVGANERRFYLNPLIYFISILLPFAILLSLNDLKDKLKILFLCGRRLRIIFPVTRNIVGNAVTD